MTRALTLSDNSLERYMTEVKRYPLLSRDEEVRLARRFRDQGDIQAVHQLVVSNLRFVVKIAHEYRAYGFRLLDLVQEGNVGLMVAVKKFDVERGYRLISYAVWWIRAYIQSFIVRSWSLVKLGTSKIQRKLFFKLRSIRAEAERHARGQAVSSEQLAQALEVHHEHVDQMTARLAARDFSLDAQIAPDAAITHLDRVTDEVKNQEELLSDREEQKLLRTKVADAMEHLNDKERYIVEHRLLSDEPVTLQEIGTTFKVSRERIRQLENRLMGKLRTALEAATP